MRLLPSVLASLLLATSASAADLMHFWDEPQHGGNSFNRLPPDEAYFEALKGYGASWVRLSYDKWKPEKRDFLIGDADKYEGIPAGDLAVLKAALDRADKAGLKVVITPLSLPGMRWAQNNGDQFDGRLWQGEGVLGAIGRLLEGSGRSAEGSPGCRGLQHHQRTGPGKEQWRCRARRP